MNLEQLKTHIRTIPDFPKPGIQFKDISTLLLNPEAFRTCIEAFYTQYKDQKIDAVVGIESRGFLFAAPLALKLGCPMVIARKPGKLPGETLSVEYQLEYGTDRIEMHADAIQKGMNVLIMDDLLATGGTARATAELVRKLGGEVCGHAFVIDLTFLNGAAALKSDAVYSILEY